MLDLCCKYSRIRINPSPSDLHVDSNPLPRLLTTDQNKSGIGRIQIAWMGSKNQNQHAKLKKLSKFADTSVLVIFFLGFLAFDYEIFGLHE